MGELRPEWISILKSVLKNSIAPLFHAMPECPIYFLADTTHADFLPDRGISAVEIVDSAVTKVGFSFHDNLPSANSGRHALHRSLAKLCLDTGDMALPLLKMPFSRLKEIQLAPAQAGRLLEQLKFHIGFLTWYYATDLASQHRSGHPFENLIGLAKEGKGTVSDNALLKALASEKMTLSLPWVQRRICAATRDKEKLFLIRVSTAIQTASAPRQFRSAIMDMVLCFFNSWLEEMTLEDQSRLFAHCQIPMTARELRNRRNRLQLNAIRNASCHEGFAQAAEMEHLIRNTKNLSIDGGALNNFFLQFYSPILRPIISHVLTRTLEGNIVKASQSIAMKGQRTYASQDIAASRPSKTYANHRLST